MKIIVYYSEFKILKAIIKNNFKKTLVLDDRIILFNATDDDKLITIKTIFKDEIIEEEYIGVYPLDFIILQKAFSDAN